MNNSETMDPIPLAPAPIKPSAKPESSLLGRLVNIADTYRGEHAYRQAIEMYFELVENHPDTPEGQRAHQALLEIGEWYEHIGEFRQARSLYERMLGGS